MISREREREIVGFRTPTPFMVIAIASFFTDFREQRLREFAKFWLHHSIDGIWMLPEIVSSFVKHKKTIDGSNRCWVYDQSPTLARNGEDQGYIRMDKYLHWNEAFWGIAQEQIHEGLGPKWTISYQCGDRWCP